LLSQLKQQLSATATLNSTITATNTSPTSTEIVNALLKNMTLDEKLGQMMMVQFLGGDYSQDLSVMVNQYHAGAVVLIAGNSNIVSASQLKELTTQIQANSDLPVITAIDQEGGYVDRLKALDGAQPSAASIGASGDINQAYQQGITDATDLAKYGLNLQLAPVVDVTTVYNAQMNGRTYGNNATIVTNMAGAYLQGLQNNSKVLGTLKHFPGLGNTSTDPHTGLPEVTRSLDQLYAVDWAPYKQLISQGNVDAVMVTHEIVDAVDKTMPSSLSPRVIGILRNQLGFQGVIVTDSLTMDALSMYSYGQAAALAVEAGDDLLMGAWTPTTMQEMITGIKDAINAGAISQSRIDDSVRRILLLKYQMGLIHL
jgi:beta-N-acetylhexosaminidase